MKYWGTVYKAPQTKCKDCTDRHPACHDTCETYQQALGVWIEQKKAIKQKKREATLVLRHEVETTLKAVNRNNKRR